MSRKDIAIELRKKGYSYSHIQRVTGYSVSTLSYHLSHIPYVPNKETVASIGNALAKSAEVKSQKKVNALLDAKRQAQKDVGILTSRDIFMLGLGIYIGEGSKTQSHVRLVNADPKVLRLYVRWLRMLGLRSENLSVRIHLYPDTPIQEAESYWCKQLGVPLAQFQSPSIDRRVGKDRKRSATHTYGTAHVTVRANGNKSFGVALSRRIGAWMEEVLE